MGCIFEHAEQYLDCLDSGVYVEIGTSRNGDDGSTRTIAGWAQARNTTLITVDLDPVNCEFVCDMNLPNTTVVNSTGEQYLQARSHSEQPISFLYLDNFDWNWHPEKTEDFVLEQQLRYREFGIELNNVNSQRAHLMQAITALDHMTERSLIVCDDTWYNLWWGHYSGKSGAVVPFLMNHGFEVLYTHEQPIYGTILGRGIAKR